MIELIVNGQKHGGWLSVGVETSLEALASTFTVSATEHWPEQAVDQRPIKAGDPVEVRLESGALLLSGYIEQTQIDISKDARNLSFSGRSKTADLIDCSAPLRQWKGATPAQIVGDLLKPFGIASAYYPSPGPNGPPSPSGEGIALFQTQPTESVGDAIIRLAKQAGLLPYASPDGGLIMKAAVASAAAPVTTLIIDAENANLKALTLATDTTEVYSEVSVLGQVATTNLRNGRSASQVRATAMAGTAALLNRYRPLRVMAETQMTLAQAQTRAGWEVKNRNARALRVNATVAGWMVSGSPWSVNTLVRVKAPKLGFDRVLLVAGVRFSLDDPGGTVTELSLVDPDSY